MKEFEKWLEKYSHGETITQRYELADAWKAALKWVLITDFLHAMNKEFLIKKIQKELEEK